MPIETITETKRRLFDVQAACAPVHELGAEGVTVNFVRNLINRAEIPHLRMGKKLYVSREALENCIQRDERRKCARNGDSSGTANIDAFKTHACLAIGGIVCVARLYKPMFHQFEASP